MKMMVMTILMCGLFFAGSIAVNAEEFPETGETFHYAIKKMGLKAGDAILEYKGLVEKDGRQYVQIIFTADGFNFYDQEVIFTDPKTLLPVRVERDLNIFGSKEQLIEDYDAAEGSVRIVKYKNEEKVDEYFFQKDQPIDNLYCFLYRFRKNGKMAVGQKINLCLPTADIEIMIADEKQISAAGRKNGSWYLKSVPSKYRIWLGKDAPHIPLRIDGAVGFGKTAMILVE